MDRAKSRYGGKSKSKSHKDKDLDKWTADDAKAYMDSKDGQEHAAKMSKAQQLLQPQPEADAQSPEAMPSNAAAAAPAMPAA